MTMYLPVSDPGALRRAFRIAIRAGVPLATEQHGGIAYWVVGLRALGAQWRWTP